MNLANRQELPPGGWLYEQTAHGHTKKFKNMGPFMDAAKEIAGFRRENNLPRATVSEAAEDLDAYTCQRLGFDPRYVAQKKIGAWVSSEQVANLREAAKRAGQSLSHIKTGAEILADWVGEGGQPVDPPLAQLRTNTCVNCEFNRKGAFFTKVTALAARAIHEQRRHKLDLALRTEGEENLRTCDVCDCHLPLKVWVPLPTILNRTDAEMQKKFPAHCWILTEQQIPIQDHEPNPTDEATHSNPLS